MKKIGVTGNIGAGKSQVCRIFAILGVPIYSADEMAKQLMVSDEKLIHQIRKLFGPGAYDANGQLCRAFIAGIVFADRHQLDALNALVHPAVARDFDRWTDLQKGPYVIKEAALLFESGSYRQLDHMILVRADEKTRLQRVMHRDQLSETEVRKRMDNQMPQETKEKLTDLYIDNDGKRPLVAQVLQLHTLFMKQSRN